MKLVTALSLANAALLSGCAVVPYDPYYGGYGGYGYGPAYSGSVVVESPVVVGGYYRRGYWHDGYYHHRYWR